MSIDEGNIITLSDKCDYLVVSKCTINRKDYYYLVDTECKNVKYMYLDNNEMVLIKDKKLLKLIVERMALSILKKSAQ